MRDERGERASERGRERERERDRETEREERERDSRIALHTSRPYSRGIGCTHHYVLINVLITVLVTVLITVLITVCTHQYPSFSSRSYHTILMILMIMTMMMGENG
jgi:hypothetical protein